MPEIKPKQDVNGHTLLHHEVIAENPDAPWLVFVHGAGGSIRTWKFQIDAFAPHFRLLLIDLRDHGYSKDILPEFPAYDFDIVAKDILVLTDHLGIEKIPVVGHSMGAFVSVVFAHRHPSRVESLLLVDGGLPLDVPPGLDADAVVAHVLGPTAARLSMRFGSIDDYLEFWRPHPAFAQAWSPEIESYFAYDLVDDGSGMLRPATSYETMVDDKDEFLKDH